MRIILLVDILQTGVGFKYVHDVAQGGNKSTAAHCPVIYFNNTGCITVYLHVTRLTDVNKKTCTIF